MHPCFHLHIDVLTQPRTTAYILIRPLTTPHNLTYLAHLRTYTPTHRCARRHNFTHLHPYTPNPPPTPAYEPTHFMHPDTYPFLSRYMHAQIYIYLHMF